MSRPTMLLDWDETPLRVFQAADWKLRDRGDSTNRLTVTTSLAEAKGVRSEQQVIFKGRRFAIDEIDSERADGLAEFKADEVQAELKGHVLESYKVNSWTLPQAVGVALEGTRWSMGEVQHVRYGRSDFEDITVLDALKFLASHQDSRLTFDSLRRRVNITPQAGKVHEIVFTYGRQLTNIRKVEKAPRTTVIHPTGADGLTVASVNGGETSVEDYGYYLAQGMSLAEARQHRKEEYWEDSRYTVAENLLRDTQKRLAEEAYPQISYTLTAAATTSVEGADDFDLGTLHLGDQVYVWDNVIPAKLRAEVTEVTTSSDATVNRLTLAYLPPSLDNGVESSYFGDSGRPADGPDQSISVPQPRPSMPILVSINNLGNGKVRWNGQDEHGVFETIPERFGTLETRAAKLLADGSIPSPESEESFSGTVIDTRGGGVSSVSFGVAGEYAVWFRLVSWNGQTISEWSEALVIDAPELVDSEEIRSEVASISDRVGEGLQTTLTAALTSTMANLQEFRDEWDSEWDPEAMSALEKRQGELEDDLEAKASTSELDAVTSGVAALTGTNAKTWTQDTPPPAPQGAATYEWAYGAHASESIKRVNGVEVARNLAQNPSFEDGDSWWHVGFADWRTTDWEAFWGHRGSGDLIELTSDGTGDARVRSGRVYFNGGQWLAARALVATEQSRKVQFRWGTFGDTSGFANGEWIDAPWYTGAEYKWVTQAGADRDRGDLDIQIDSGDNVGSRLWVDRVVIAVADTEAEAHAAVDSYWDGDTPNAAAESGIWINTAENNARYWWDHEEQDWLLVTDNAAFGRVVADRIFANLGVYDRLDAREGWIGGVALEDGGIKARHADMEDFTASKAFLDSAMVNLIRGRLAEFDEALIGGVLIKDHAISLEKLVVGRGSNLIPNASLTQGDKGHEAFWGGDSNFGRNDGNGPDGQPSLWVEGRTTTKSEGVVPLEAGQQYHLRVLVRGDNAGKRFYIQMLTDGASNPYPISGAETLSYEWEEFRGSFTAPGGATEAGIQVYANHQNGDTTDGYQWFTGWQLYEKVGAVQIEDGAVKAPKIDVDDLAASEARMEILFAGMAKFSEAQIDTLLGNSAKFKQIEGAVIMGGRVEGADVIGGNVSTADSIYGDSPGGARMSGGADGGEFAATQNGDTVFRAGYRGAFFAGDVEAIGTIRSGTESRYVWLKGPDSNFSFPRLEILSGGGLDPAYLGMGTGAEGEADGGLTVFASSREDGGHDRTRVALWQDGRFSIGRDQIEGIHSDRHTTRVSARQDLILETRDPGGEVRIGTNASNSDATEGFITGRHSSNGAYSKVYTRSGSYSPNVYQDGNYIMYRSSSLEGGKIDIDRDPLLDLDAIKRLNPTTFRDRGEMERGGNPPVQLGLIAQDVEELGLTVLNTWDEDGSLLGVAYDRVPEALILWNREQETRLDDLEAQVKALGGVE